VDHAFQHGDLGTLFVAMPELRRLSLHGDLGFRPFQHVALNTLHLSGDPLRTAHVEALGKCSLPALQELEIVLCEEKGRSTHSFPILDPNQLTDTCPTGVVHCAHRVLSWRARASFGHFPKNTSPSSIEVVRPAERIFGSWTVIHAPLRRTHVRRVRRRIPCIEPTSLLAHDYAWAASSDPRASRTATHPLHRADSAARARPCVGGLE
jgi:hypothetical protein